MVNSENNSDISSSIIDNLSQSVTVNPNINPVPSTSSVQIKQPIANYQRVVNLSDYPLSKSHISVLEKGITFSPTPGEADIAQIHNDVCAFIRRIKLKTHFYDEDNPNDDSFKKEIPPGLVKFRPPSNWTPPRVDPHVQLFANNVIKDLSTAKLIQPQQNNLTKEEKTALSDLKNNRQIIIKKADKGSSIVVMNIKDYIVEAERQLSDTAYYKEVETDLTPKHHKVIETILENLSDKQLITLPIYKCLTNPNPKTAGLYLLPKLHKIKQPGQFPPGRPIISANQSPTERISAFVDENIKAAVPHIPSYIKDTTHFINKIESILIPPNSYLVTFDVVSLYTNIPNTEGINAVSRSLKHYPPPYTDHDTVLKLLRLVLSLNNFTFNGRNYLQIGGTAMGTKLAPSYANIFMGDLESTMLNQSTLEPYLWLRFIDDIFVIWTHGLDKLHEFHNSINAFHNTIKFTMEFSQEKIVFLDTLVKKNIDQNKLLVELYTKPTDTHNYLHFKSSHPGHTKRGGPYGQFLRIRRNCTLVEDYIKHSLIMKEHYINRGYPHDLVELSRIKALNQDRSTLLTYKKQDSQPSATNIVPLVLTHHPSNHQVRKLVMDNWGLLQYSDLCKKSLPEAPLFATRRGTNLKDTLIHSRLNPYHTPGVSGRVVPNTWVQCDQLKKKAPCKICPAFKTTNFNATSTVTNQSYQLPNFAQCTTTNVIYLLTCSKCKIQYVGETKNTFRRRFLDHCGYIRRKEKQPTAVHILGHQDSDCHYIPQILEVINKDPNNPATTKYRKKREVFWIYRLKTLIPRGLNKLS